MTCIYFGLDIFVGLIILKSIYVFLFFFIPKIFKKWNPLFCILKISKPRTLNHMQIFDCLQFWLTPFIFWMIIGWGCFKWNLIVGCI